LDFKIFSGEANLKLAQDIAAYLGVSLRPMHYHHFPDGESKIRYGESIRGERIFIIQSLSPNPDNSLMQLLMMIDAAKRAGAEYLNIVIPYLCYMRQDGKEHPREPISARLVADLIHAAAGTIPYHVVTVEMHAKQQEGYFQSITPLYARLGKIDYFKNILPVENLVVVAPDANAAKQARAFAQRIGNCPLAVIDKRRPQESKAEVVNVIGDVSGRTALLVDDMVDTGGTLCEAIEAILAAGAKKAYAFCAHGVLSGSAVERISNSKIEKLFITDTIYHRPEKFQGACGQIEIISIAPLLGEAIRIISAKGSVSSLFE